MSSRRLPVSDAPRATCGGECASRRAFLHQALAGTMAAGIAAIAESRALPIGPIEALAAQADERKYPIPAGDSVNIDRDHQVMLVRYRAAVYAFNLSCPHEAAALRWRQKDGRFQCPRHESKYRPDGVFITGRATRHTDRLGIRRDGDAVAVDLSRMYRSDTDAAGWSAAVVTL
jgi:Rieske Fe-S protein